MDLRRGRHGRTRRRREGALLDRDRRREPLDMVDLGLLHLLEELPGVGGEALDVLPLPLRVDGVQGEGGLAGARDPGHHDQGATGEVEVDPLEVVLPGAADDDPLLHAPQYSR